MSYSRDGKTIAYSVLKSRFSALYAGPAVSPAKIYRTSGTIWSVDISPDGLHVLFSENYSSSGKYYVRIKVIDCQKKVTSTVSPEDSFTHNARFDPINHNRFFYLLDFDVWTALIDGTKHMRLTTDFAARHLSVSPNGKWLAVAGKDWDIWLCDTECKHAVNITESLSGCICSCFSPSGNQLAVQHGFDDISEIDISSVLQGGWPPTGE